MNSGHSCSASLIFVGRGIMQIWPKIDLDLRDVVVFIFIDNGYIIIVIMYIHAGSRVTKLQSFYLLSSGDI